jgi:hypothetical protein
MADKLHNQPGDLGRGSRSLGGTLSMTFRHIRKSRDGYTSLGLALTLVAVIAGGVFVLSDTSAPRVFPVVFLTLFSIAFGWFTRCVLFPFEWEVVVEADQVRWGRVDRLDQQERVTISQLVRLIHDKSDNQVLGDVGSWRHLNIGIGILIRPDDQRAFVEHLHQRFPHLNIETI